MRTRLLLTLCAAALLAGCAGPNSAAGTPAADGHVAGILQGLFNGITAPFTFIWSLFDPSVHFYEVHNNGWPYNLGFLLGIGAFSSSSGAGACRRRPRTRTTQ